MPRRIYYMVIYDEDGRQVGRLVKLPSGQGSVLIEIDPYDRHVRKIFVRVGNRPNVTLDYLKKKYNIEKIIRIALEKE